MRRFVPLLFFLSLPLTASAEWKELAPGLSYEARPESQAHVFRIDLKKNRVDVLTAPVLNRSALTAREFREHTQAVLAVNGGFFDAAFQGMGLIVRDGKVLQPLRASAWGIFAVSKDEARILHRKDWNPKGVTAALQVGPRLVVDGEVQHFKEAGPSRRSAVGITPEGEIEIAVAEKPMLLSEWAAFMGKDCPNVLNLDGGGSTQISVHAGDFDLNVEGYTAVPNALGIFSRR
ncbi:MAG TPA: phosphodiester glycosidase family protein [bacterium]|nr:phosphodiester glycosidase family protein [bacterium]